MKVSKQLPPERYDVVEKKVQEANKILKNVDMNQLHQTIKKARCKSEK